MTGAYQDAMGDLHNLFGMVNEAHVVLDEHGKAVVHTVQHGDQAHDTLRTFGHDADWLTGSLEQQLEQQIVAGKLDRETAAELMERYRAGLARYTYLS